MAPKSIIEQYTLDEYVQLINIDMYKSNIINN